MGGDAKHLADRQALATIYHEVLRQAAVMSYLDGFRVLAIILLTATPFIWIMRKPRFKRPGSAA